ncbi:hypothetical protein MLD38_019970 [Melastoma candidum]|uniref:Uncharacterized protein n=1 Tax=Melastoma candidum TaxID=119954 RepID=A0ACB9QCF5_9MYRT|nr:hypothetical protein MLD38_019970 [Melastoma candidum]
MMIRMFPGLRAALSMVFVFGLVASASGQLQMNYYAKSCPRAEKLVQDYVREHVPRSPNLAAAILRMYFHDCFVRGCDGSVLINSTANNRAEKESIPNQTVRGFDFIDRVKSILEAECPGIVSCADVLALVTRECIVVTGGPSWRVPTGRRDGVISSATEATNNIPPPSSNLTTLQRAFTNKGLDLKDLVILSGSHTIGLSHCSSFSSRLYNFTGKGDQDPAMDPKYAAILKSKKCRNPNDNNTVVEMDPGSFKTFDLSYYSLLLKRRGIHQSDSALITSSSAKAYVTELLKGSQENFYAEFALAMEKMGRIEVKTGSAGVIRKHCALAN